MSPQKHIPKYIEHLIFRGHYLTKKKTVQNPIQWNLDLRKPDLRKNLDLRKIVATTGFLVHKLLDLRKIF